MMTERPTADRLEQLRDFAASADLDSGPHMRTVDAGSIRANAREAVGELLVEVDALNAEAMELRGALVRTQRMLANATYLLADAERRLSGSPVEETK